jgi:hypothetical protein
MPYRIAVSVMLVLCMSYFNLSFSQDTIKTIIKTNAINIAPINIVFGSYCGYYECLLGGRHGCMIQGEYIKSNTSKGYDCALTYRYHFFKRKNHAGLNSPFLGAFLYYEKSENQIEIERSTYSVDYKAYKLGLQWGRRWIFWKGLDLCLDIGYGFPLHTDYGWSPIRPNNGDQLELLATIEYGLMWEASIGFAF